MYCRRAAHFLLAILVVVPTAAAQDGKLWVGPNVNMVSGTTFPDGDPFLQRQNEPSAGVSTRNPLHILAGANDYRAVDIPGLPEGKETGDSWLGVFESLDGGSTWKSYLLAGYPQDDTPEGVASPLKIYDAGADPVVRAGTDGLLYYAGLVFIRENLSQSAIFVARFEDLNNDEAGDPIVHLDTRLVTTASGNIFVDKPWMAVDIPRGGAQCGNVYVAWAEIDSSGLSPASTIMFSASTDCGANWATPIPLSAPGTLPQGATIAVAPATGDVYVAWRQHTSLSITECFFGGGHWKNHPEEWPVDTVTIGGVTYTKAQALEILGSPIANDATYIVAKALIAAKLNQLELVDATAASLVAETDAWLADHPLGSKPKKEEKEEGILLSETLEAYNTGLLGSGKCETEPPLSNNAIVVRESINDGVSFGPPIEVAGIDPFDQGTSPYSFRSNSYPTMTVDEAGRAYLAWTTRGLATGPAVDPDAETGDARIVVSTSMDGLNWTLPQPIDQPEVSGHQIKPSLTYTRGQLLLVYYDFREDVSGIFNRFVADLPSATPTPRHTVDVRAAVADPGAVPVFTDYTSVLDPIPSTQASRYAFLVVGNNELDAEGLQLQYNPPNLPMFKGGTAPFFSDYLDVTPSPPFVPDGFGGWTYNTSPGSAAVAHAVWTDDRDVVGPPDGDWTNFIPPTHPNSGGTSIFDPGQTVPECQPGTLDVDRTRIRNQNIYTARLTKGLYVAVPGNSRPLGYVPGSPSDLLQRAFVVFVQNTTNEKRDFRLEITEQPLGGEASFDQFTSSDYADVTIEAYSSAARTVFVTSNIVGPPWPSVEIDVTETYPAIPVPLRSTVRINPDPWNPAPADPGVAEGEIYNPSIYNPSIYNPSIYNPSILNPSIYNPSIFNPSIYNPSIYNPSIYNPSIYNPSILNPSIYNPSIYNPSIYNPSIYNPSIYNPSIYNPSIYNPSIYNPSILNPSIYNVTESSVTDVTWTVKNDGNATAAYSFNLLADQVPSNHVFQLMVYRVYTTPVADGCELTEEGQQETLVNILDPNFAAPNLLDPNTFDPEAATFYLEPGEVAFVTLRAVDENSLDAETFEPETVQVAVVAQGVGTEAALEGETQQPYDIPDMSFPTSSTLADSRVNHTATLLADGRILITGGSDPSLTVLDTAEIFDPATKTFTPTAGDMSTAREHHTATLLNDGTVLIFGGETGGAKAELFDPATETFSTVFMTYPGQTHRHSATLLADGRVAIIGGMHASPTAATLIYDPSAPLLFRFTKVGSMSSWRADHTATLLTTGEVLVTGGFDGTTNLDTAELFDPVTNLFSPVAGPTSTMSDPRRHHSATLLPDGTVLLAGGFFDATDVASSSADIYDRATDSFVPADDMNIARAAHSATLMTDGTVLLVGGETTVSGNVQLFAHIESYDWSTGTFTEKGYLSVARSDHTAVRMTRGRVLITGGTVQSSPTVNGTDTSELYFPASPPKFFRIGGLETERMYHTVTPLLVGDVVVVGGMDGDFNGIDTIERFSPASEEFTTVATMPTSRMSHSETRLNDGTVLIAGGRDQEYGTILNSALIYDPSNDSVTPTGSLNTARAGHTATLLQDGRVLFASGTGTGGPLASTEIYDPSDGSFTPSDSLATARRTGGAAVLLNDGRVLIAGGRLAWPGVTAAFQLWDPATETFGAEGFMNEARRSMRHTLLADGTVLIVGGSDGTDYLDTAEIFDPATDTFSYTAGRMKLRRISQTQFRLQSGEVLVAGGISDGSILLSYAELYDPETQTFRLTDIMNGARSGTRQTRLDDGRVLIIGGMESYGPAGRGVSSAVEVYEPPPLSEAQIQRNALIALYIATNGDDWTNNTNWRNAAGTGFNDPGTECTWFGVICDAGGTRVEEIEMPYNNVVGPFPPEIGDLRYLEDIILHGNRVAGVFPLEIGKLSSLERIIMNGNRVTSISPVLGNLDRLTTIALGYNRLTGPIPPEIGNLTDLVTLRADFNQLTGPLPSELGNLDNLRTLNLESNQIDGPIPPELGNATSLRNVRLHYNQLSGPIPPEIGNFTNMEFLHLNENQLTGPIPSELGNLTKLQKLTLQKNNLTGQFPPQLGNLKDLWELLVWSNDLSGELPPEIGGLTSMKNMGLAGNRFSGRIPSELGNLVTVERLFMQGNAFVGPIPTSLTNLTNIKPKQLDIRRNGLYSTDPILTAHLNSVQDGGDWQSTQTIAPAGFAASSPTSTSVTLSWTPINYTGHTGGYEVHYSSNPGGPYVMYGIRTVDKTVSSMVVDGLNPDTDYYFVVRTITDAGAGNKNSVISEFSPEVSATTLTPLVITTTTLPYGAVGSVYTPYALTATGGTPPYTWSMAPGSGPLPDGLGLSAAGVITGTPTASGTFDFRARVTDPTRSGEKDLNIQVVPLGGGHIFLDQPATSTAGQPIPDFRVLVLDQTGSPLPGYTVSLEPGNKACPSATMSPPLPINRIADSFGVAIFSGIEFDRGGYGYTLQAISTIMGSAVTTESEPFGLMGFCEAASMGAARIGATMTRLSDGTILVVGGVIQADSFTPPQASAEIFDPVTGSWTPTGNLNVARALHTATLLADGRVLIAGGTASFLPAVGAALMSAEIFDPAGGGSFTTVGTLTTSRMAHTATLLEDGSVLIAGGRTGATDSPYLASAEVFNPKGDSFAAISDPMTSARDSHRAVRLGDGRVLLMGGLSAAVPAPYLNSADIFDPGGLGGAGEFTATGAMAYARINHTATMLDDGRVLVAGGTDGSATLAFAEVYDPSVLGGSFGAAIAMSSRENHAAAGIPNGHVLLMGGMVSSPPIDVLLQSAEIFDPQAGTFTPTHTMITHRQLHLSSELVDGRVLLSGGTPLTPYGITSAEIFWPMGGENLWARQMGSEEDEQDVGISVGSEGVYVTAGTEAALPGQTSAGGDDVFIHKCDFAGNEVWTWQFGTAEDDYNLRISVAVSGVYVAGQTRGAFPGFSNAGSRDVFVRKYDFDGTEIWTQQFGTTEFETPTSISIDVSGVYLAGETNGALPGQSNQGAFDGFVRKYDFDGTEIWTRQFGSEGSDYVSDISVSSSGVYLSGWTPGALPGETDAFVRKYNHDGTASWARQFGTADRDIASGISADISGVYVAGRTASTLPGQTSAGSYDAFVRKYDFGGTEIWTHQFGTADFDESTSITVDGSGVFVAGSTSGAFPGQTSEGSRDAFVRKYDHDGAAIWTRQFGTSGRDVDAEVSTHTSGLYVAGYTDGTWAGETSAGGDDVYVLKIVD